MMVRYSYVDGEVLVREEEEPLDAVVEAMELWVGVDGERSTTGDSARQVEQRRDVVHDEPVAEWIGDQ